MKPIVTNATTTVLGAPVDWDSKKHGECVGLPVHVSEDPYVYSWWRLTLRERFLVLMGRPVQLCIVGRTHAPVSLEVASCERRSWWYELKRICNRLITKEATT